MEEKTRHFGGELNVFIDRKGTPLEIAAAKAKRNFEKKHLKGYLNGDKYFSFGLDEKRNPIYYVVNEIWK
jgi:hypothetical protein